MTFGNNPLPRVMKMKRIGGRPDRFVPKEDAERCGIMPGMERPPMARKAFLMNSRLLFMVSVALRAGCFVEK
jgi:hypothetical protein